MACYSVRHKAKGGAPPVRIGETLRSLPTAEVVWKSIAFSRAGPGVRRSCGC